MSFQSLQIRYQTARSLPAPYAYFYTLAINTVAAKAIQVELAITYPDRDEIDDDELIAEGYTRDDDFTWSGKLPKAWWEAFATLVRKTRLHTAREEDLGEDDDFWDITVTTETGSKTIGRPVKTDDWQYLIQELIQATYEAGGRELPFNLIYLNLENQTSGQELRLTASFADRTVHITSVENRQEQTKTVPWSTLQHVMSQVYSYDYDPDDAHVKRPRRDGQWLNLGTEEWYDISSYKALTKLFRDL